jgi:uncharacterized membrane protein
MSTVRETVEVGVPVHTAYNQWTQFEEFPNFMEGVEEVRQVDDRHNHWTTKIGGVRREFDTEIVDQLPDERVTWRTTSGDTNQKGSVRFERVDDTHTRVELVMEVEPSGAMDKVADMMGTIDRRVKGDMRRFKEYIEERGAESGAWRGRIQPGGGTGPAGGTGPTGPTGGTGPVGGTDPLGGTRGAGGTGGPGSAF